MEMMMNIVQAEDFSMFYQMSMHFSRKRTQGNSSSRRVCIHPGEGPQLAVQPAPLNMAKAFIYQNYGKQGLESEAYSSFCKTKRPLYLSYQCFIIPLSFSNPTLTESHLSFYPFFFHSNGQN